VTLAGEEQQQRVAPELEHVAAVPLGDRDERIEDRRDGGDELLGALSSARGQSFREGREAGDVDGDERPLEGAPARPGLRAPGVDETRHVRCEQRPAGDGPRRHRSRIARSGPRNKAGFCMLR
jgi:hypothetical protein